MSLLSWDRPKRAHTPAAHAEAFGADGAPPGTYVPNMSDEDAERWKAKVTGQKRGVLQVEIRRSFPRGGDLVLIVCLNGGYTYKSYKPRDPSARWCNWGVTDDRQIHLAINGALQLTFDEIAEIQTVVEEARAKLRELEVAQP
jgi:hypothetical protein